MYEVVGTEFNQLLKCQMVIVKGRTWEIAFPVADGSRTVDPSVLEIKKGRGDFPKRPIPNEWPKSDPMIEGMQNTANLWLKTARDDDMDQDTNDDAIWLQNDAAHGYKWAAIYRDRGTSTNDWVAVKVQAAAAHSARLARQRMGLES